jgi:hypothetical protein
MTSYASNFTPRYKATYLAGGIQHTIQVREARGASFATVEARRGDLHDIFNALASGLYDDFAWLSAEVALTDDDVFAPALTPTSVTGVIDGGTISAYKRCHGLTFTGRAAGSRGKFTMFGILLGTDQNTDEGANGVITAAEIAGVGTIAGIASAHFHAGSGALAVYPNAATYKVNDLLLRRVRKGTIT